MTSGVCGYVAAGAAGIGVRIVLGTGGEQRQGQKVRDHLAYMAELAAFLQHLEAFLRRPPLQNLDRHMPHSPSIHGAAIRLEQIDRIRADHGAPGVVNDILATGFHHPKARP